MKTNQKTLFAGSALVAGLIFYRLLAAGVFGGGWTERLPNFSPMGAVVVCGAFFFAGAWSWAIPLAALALSDVALNLHYGSGLVGSHTVAIFVGFALVFILAKKLRGNRSLYRLLGSGVLAAVVFHLLANTTVWLAWHSAVPAYTPTLSGWWAAQVLGDGVHSPAAIFFLRNAIIANVLFCTAFYATLSLALRRPTVGEKLAAAPIRRG